MVVTSVLLQENGLNNLKLLNSDLLNFYSSRDEFLTKV